MFFTCYLQVSFVSTVIPRSFGDYLMETRADCHLRGWYCCSGRVEMNNDNFVVADGDIVLCGPAGKHVQGFLQGVVTRSIVVNGHSQC